MNTAYIIIMVVCLIFSAYFSATETAFSTLSKTKLKAMAEKGNKRAARTLAISENFDRLISTILIGNNIVNILLASVATVFFVDLLANTDKANMAPTISTAITTIIVLIFGEVTPKSVASDFPEKFAMFSSPLIRVITWLFYPLSFLFSLWKKLLSKMLRIQPNNKISQEELLMMVEEVQEDGTIDDNEGDLIRNAITFTDQKAEDILTHRVDLEAFPVTATKDEIAQMFIDSQFSRLIVYDDSIDNIVGILHQKDFFTATGITDKPLKDIVVPPLFIHQSERIDDILRSLQTHKSHLAVVLDEYGGTLGIVTMEDILEELVGEIWDEHDEVVEEIKEIEENTFRIDCGVGLDDFEDYFNMEIESESITVNGWIIESLDRFPSVGDKFTYENLDITITEADSHRISTAEVYRNPRDESDSDDPEKKDKLKIRRNRHYSDDQSAPNNGAQITEQIEEEKESEKIPEILSK